MTLAALPGLYRLQRPDELQQERHEQRELADRQLARDRVAAPEVEDGGDPERRHGFDAALAEYERLENTYPALGYEVIVLPKAPVDERVDFVLARL